MNISALVINPLAKFICGDTNEAPYMTGTTLVEFFRRYGFQDNYESGFPSRWVYTEEKVKSLNGTTILEDVLIDVLDSRRYLFAKVSFEHAIHAVNNILKFDGYMVVLENDKVIIKGTQIAAVESKIAVAIDHRFIFDQIIKATEKVNNGDYSGAITNARSLIEAVCIDIIEKKEAIEVRNDGNVDSLWARTKKALKLDLKDKTDLPESIFQILGGIDTAVKGFAGLSNNASDRHATKFKTRKHHARLAVNLSLAIADFLFESMEYQSSNSNAT
ncbi:abortive infection family protein [Mucilaginibacter ginkgonis]|uniref:Abortive infection family protein n=1 Tax=Mucilaginibacter ginkgonis TaxID=2682091 RepID=A0A6I4HZJ8_9SPHI|nr:abortive infection family protein [Mucilaginibacter ginkgonis]QQL50121.1 abortive infection family protein [Mucilaginibacter ginkgonis]